MQDLSTMLPQVAAQAVEMIGENVSISRGDAKQVVPGTNRVITTKENIWEGKAIKEYKDTLQRMDYGGQYNRSETNAYETQHTKIRFYIVPGESQIKRGDTLTTMDGEYEIQEVYTERIGSTIYYQTLHTKCMQS